MFSKPTKAQAKREMFDEQTSSNIAWWSNILVFASPGQTLQTRFIKHRQTSERKELRATKLPIVPQQFQHGGICEPNMFDTNEPNVIKQTWEQKKYLMLFDRVFDGVQTPSNIIKKDGQTVKCLIKHFPFGQGLKDAYFKYRQSMTTCV